MGKRPECRDIGPRSRPNEGELCDGECVNALRVAHLLIYAKNATYGARTRNINSFGPDHYATYNMARGKRPPIFTGANGTAARDGRRELPPPILQTQNGTTGLPLAGRFAIFQVPGNAKMEMGK